MRAADVDGERRLGAVPGAADVRRRRRSGRPPPAERARSPRGPRRDRADRRLPTRDAGRPRAASRRRAGARRRSVSRRSPASRSSRWLPAKPAAPVTRIVRWHRGPATAARRSSAPLNGEKLPRPASVNDMKKRWSTARELKEPKLYRLVLERQTAALRVVEARDALLQQVRVQDVVVERVDAAELVVAACGSLVEALIDWSQQRRIVEAGQLRDVAALAPAERRLHPVASTSSCRWPRSSAASDSGCRIPRAWWR